MTLTDGQRDWLALTLVPGVGTTLFVRLLSRFKTATEVLGASEAGLAEVVGPKLGERIRQYRDVVDVDGQIGAMGEYGARLITLEDSAYPHLLGEIYDPPLVLFSRGELHEADQNAVAIVGTRKATSYGLRMAERLGGELAARGVTVVSGLASGVDAAAHRGALDAGGRTIAILGCGVDIVYPSENADLMHQIVQRGCVLSSFPMGVKPARGHFPNRNRIISGLCLGTLVVEAPPGSGALLTARHAAEQGREVFAVPGHAGERNAMGPHSLLREGARLVETVEDVLVELNLPAGVLVTHGVEVASVSGGEDGAACVAAPPLEPKVSTVEKDVLSVLALEGSFVDEIALACRIPVSEALGTLTLLELKGLVRQFSGKRFAPR